MIVAMTKVLLVLPSTSYRNGAFVLAASHLNLDITIVTNADTPSILPPNRVYRVKDWKIDDATFKELDKLRLDAVVAVDEASVVLATELSQRLGLPTNPIDAVEATLNKELLRSRLSKHEIPQPRYIEIQGHQHPEEIAKTLADAHIRYPIVVKPTSETQSRGVSRANSYSELLQAIEIASSVTHKDNLLIEEYIDGSEHALEGVLVDSELVTLAIFDKPEPLVGPYFEESIYITPSNLPDKVITEAKRVVQRSCRSLGLWTGPIHAEFRVTSEGQLFLIEIAARSIGGSCSKALAFEPRITLEEILVSQATLGDSHKTLQATQKRSYSGVLMLPTPKSGILLSVGNLKAAEATRFVTSIEITATVGSVVKAPPFSERYMGFVFAVSPGYSTTLAALRRARDIIEIEIDDLEL
ncbi:ATP-grasp domain-containing protein [Ferrithrix thermotolerans DSM 19514]|uniref:ATP-grasp domain-containing protein n=2 Tax=Ferrithrix TaxID=643949 RepID=A0A1M4T3Z6_9ACTN|nr:ATP-grasp domain-containing protein [Ferrithrix thermotolerans DSM 19514]